MPESKAKLIAKLKKEIDFLQGKLSVARRQRPWQEIKDYSFKDAKGKAVKLSGLFGQSDELLIVHNMGKHCAYCTLWADGYNGLTQHMENRAPFAVVSPDAPAVMGNFAKARGWKFQILSSAGNSFKKDMGFGSNQDPDAGVSSFYRDKQGRLFHVAQDTLGPGDNYCAAWHFFDLLPGGRGDWAPKFKYK